MNLRRDDQGLLSCTAYSTRIYIKMSTQFHTVHIYDVDCSHLTLAITFSGHDDSTINIVLGLLLLFTSALIVELQPVKEGGQSPGVPEMLGPLSRPICNVFMNVSKTLN